MVAIAAIKPGDELWTGRRVRPNNARLSRLAWFRVEVLEVGLRPLGGPERSYVVARINGNPARTYGEHSARAWRRSKPKTA
jgi:hypothetical protein